MSRLRLAAACALLKLAQEPCYHEIITLEQYQLCALVINVSTVRFPREAHSQFQASAISVLDGFFWSFLSSAHFLVHLCSPLCSSRLPSSFILLLITFPVPSCLLLCWSRMSATRCDSVSPRSFTGACAVSVYRWNTWRCSLCAPRTPLRRGGLTLASVW